MTNKYLFSWLHKWGIANDTATEAERFSEACFVERFGRRRQNRPKTNQRKSAKSAFIIRVNPWLINDLRAYKALYICRDTFTDVMSALQISSFMQNKANFRKSQMNVNKVLTKGYENKTLGQRGKNKPKTNPNEPNQTQLKPIKCQKKPKTNPISKIFLTPFFGVFLTNILILTDILPGFTDIGPFSSIPPESGQSMQGRQSQIAAINKKLPKSLNLKKFSFQVC